MDTKTVKFSLTPVGKKVYEAYKHSKENGNRYLNIDFTVDVCMIDEVLEILRGVGIKCFTYSMIDEDVADTLYELQAQGCKVAGVIPVKVNWGEAWAGGYSVKNAFKIVILSVQKPYY